MIRVIINWYPCEFIIHKISFIVFACMMGIVGIVNLQLAYAASSSVYYSNIILDPSLTKKVNPLIFGQNAIAYDSCSYDKTIACVNKGMYSNYGAGQWNPILNKPSQDVLDLARSANITMLRFPGGCGVHNYNWKATIGNVSKRPLFEFGLDEFLCLCSAIGAQPIITMSDFTGTDDDLADMIAYLNAPANSSSAYNGTDWAAQRALNGHPEPYHVKYFEFGNETYHGNHRNIKNADPQDYARKYLVCREKFKKIDPAIHLGVVFQGWGPGMTIWDKRIAEIIKGNLDFAIVHMYPIGYNSNSGIPSAEILFSESFNKIDWVNKTLDRFTAQLSKSSGREIPIAVTEYNGDFLQEYPAPYRHSLGNALFNALLLNTFLYSNTPILCANFWQFSNSYWGSVYNKDYAKQKGSYVKRPNYFVFELYASHFGSQLISAEVVLNTDEDQSGEMVSPRKLRNKKVYPSLKLGSQNDQTAIPNPSTKYLTVSASTNKEKTSIYMIVVNKHNYYSSSSRIQIQNAETSNAGQFWLLNGPSVAAINEGGKNQVTLTHGDMNLSTGVSSFVYIFPPHSITAIEIPIKR